MITVLADCAVLSGVQLEFYRSQEAWNMFYKGLILGSTLILMMFTGFRLLWQNRIGLVIALGAAIGVVQTVLLIGEGFYSECGYGGLHAAYYGFQLALVILTTLGIIAGERYRRKA